MIQAKRIDHSCRPARCFGFFLRRKIACQNSVLTELLNFVILHFQNIDAVIRHQTDCRSGLLKILERFLVFAIRQTIPLKLHLTPMKREVLSPRANDAVIRAKVKNLVNLAERLSIRGNDHLRRVDLFFQGENLHISVLKAIYSAG